MSDPSILSENITVTLGELSRLSPAPGQVFALHVKQPISQREVDSILSTWNKAMPDSRLMIFPCGLELSVVDAGSDAA